MKRFSLTTILAVLALLVCCILPTHAEAATSGYYTYSVSGGKATITDCSTSISGDVTIPSTLGGCPVTSIGEFAFEDCSSLTSITIPNSVTSIGDGAFSSCDSLTSVTIGDSVTSIGEDAFYCCSRLTSITIPDSVTSIGNYAFEGCSSLASITIPNSVTRIGNFAFLYCSSLTSITIPNSVTSIGGGAFSSCDSLTSVTIGDSVTSIGNYAFESCSSLTSITIPNSVTSIGSSAFSDCYNLTSITIPNSVTTIGERAFSYCDSLNHVAYTGTENQWNSISIGGSNSPLTNAARHYETALQTTENCAAINIYCPVCQKTVTSIAKPHGFHAFSAATCTAPKTCTVCGAVEGDPLDHSYKAATCTAPKTCTVCGVTEGTALGHSGDIWFELIPPTCTEAGMEARICNICGVTETRELPASHRYRSVVTAPGCTEKGYTTHTCTVCGDVTVTDYVEPAGHSYKAVVTAPTCTEKGYTTHTCTVCGDVVVEEIAAKGHSYKGVVTAPTCTERGYTTNTCTVCGDVTITDYVAAKGHSWSAWITTVKPTCSTAGVQVRFCNCGIRETEPTAKLPHSFEDDICTVCGKKTVDLKIASVTLRPEAAGLYFTGSFEIAENVAVMRQGIVVSVYSSMPVADGSDPNSLWSAGATSVMVKNILRANLKDTSNQNRAAMPIYARAYVELEDGTYVYSDVSAVNLQEVVEAADGQWNTLDAIQKEAFLAMYKKFQVILQAWSIPNVKKV